VIDRVANPTFCCFAGDPWRDAKQGEQDADPGSAYSELLMAQAASGPAAGQQGAAGAAAAGQLPGGIAVQLPGQGGIPGLGIPGGRVGTAIVCACPSCNKTLMIDQVSGCVVRNTSVQVKESTASMSRLLVLSPGIPGARFADVHAIPAC
jgi:hypothetical protein